MKNEKLIYAIGKIDDDLISGAVNDTKKKYSWLRWIAAAACVCLVVGAFAAILPSRDRENIQEQLLDAIKIREGMTENVLIETKIPVENRIAVYEQIYAGNSAYIDTPESPDSTENLLPFVGDVYTQYDGKIWYRVKGMDEIKYLINEDESGTLRLWKYRRFFIMDNILFETHLFGTLGEPIDDLKRSIREKFPDADLSAYTYGDVYRIIYNVDSAKDIVSITAAPSTNNNTDLGIQIQNQVGTHTHDDRDSIKLFYDSTVNLVCIGRVSTESYYKNTWPKYVYSFSTDAYDKMESGEETWANRELTITLRSGTTIDTLEYMALCGRFYEVGGGFSKPLDEDAVYAINRIFGIE